MSRIKLKLPTYTLGRVILGLTLLVMGFIIYANGDNYYNKYYHAVRKMLLPDSMGSHLVMGTSLTWDTVITNIIKVNAFLFAVSGALILGNQRK